METDKDTDQETRELMPRLTIFANPRAEASHETDLRDIEFDLFFDLWFVASLQLLGENKDISTPGDLRAYVGFLCILWFTWFSVCLFDARFMTDSIFERIIRIVHFGAMVGFIIVLSHFDPEKQINKEHHHPFRTLTVILMIFRLALVAQYCSVYQYYRDRKDSKKAFAAAAATHLVAAIIFIGISPRFDNEHNSRAHIVWYVVSAFEAIIQLGLAWKFEVLNIRGHKLPERLAILTVVIIGEGVVRISKNIFLIVDNDQPWTSQTVGVCLSAVATSYFLFMTYFDLLRNRAGLKDCRQLIYSLLHFPFHASLFLYSLGSATFIQWWQATAVLEPMVNEFKQMFDGVDNSFPDVGNYPNASTEVSQFLSNQTASLLSKFPIKYAEQQESVDATFKAVKLIPDWYWYVPDDYNQTAVEWTIKWNELVDSILTAVLNSVFIHFEIDEYKDIQKNKTESATTSDVSQHTVTRPDEQAMVYDKIAKRAQLVYTYVFVCVGMVLLFMTILHTLTLTKYRWKPTDYLRVTLFLLASVALGLTAITGMDLNMHVAFALWSLPLLCSTVFLLFLSTHLRWPRLHRPGREPLHRSRLQTVHRPGLKRLRLSIPKATEREEKSLFESSLYHFNTHGQGHEYRRNGGVEVGSPRDYIRLQEPEYNSDRWPENGHDLEYV